jgi:transposase-like protein
LCKAVCQHGTPLKITIDGSSTNTAVIEDYNKEHDAEVEIRQVKYLNNVVEQDHRAIKRPVRPMLGFKTFWLERTTVFAAARALRPYFPLLPDLGIAQAKCLAILPFRAACAPVPRLAAGRAS